VLEKLTNAIDDDALGPDRVAASRRALAKRAGPSTVLNEYPKRQLLENRLGVSAPAAR